MFKNLDTRGIMIKNIEKNVVGRMLMSLPIGLVLGYYVGAVVPKFYMYSGLYFLASPDFTDNKPIVYIFLSFLSLSCIVFSFWGLNWKGLQNLAFWKKIVLVSTLYMLFIMGFSLAEIIMLSMLKFKLLIP